MSVHRHARKPLYRQVAETIEADLVHASAPGDALPGETALAERFGVNRLTVRQALGELAQRGLVRTVHGRGSFVAEPPIRYEISGSSEASLTRAMERQGLQVRQLLLATELDDDRELRRRLGLRRAVRRWELLRLVDERPWTLTRMWADARRFADLHEQWDGSSSLYGVLADVYDIHLRRLERDVWAEAAGPLDAEQLDVPVGAPILVLEGRNGDQHGEPVMLVHHRGRADRVRFAVEYAPAAAGAAGHA